MGAWSALACALLASCAEGGGGAPGPGFPPPDVDVVDAGAQPVFDSGAPMTPEAGASPTLLDAQVPVDVGVSPSVPMDGAVADSATGGGAQPDSAVGDSSAQPDANAPPATRGALVAPQLWQVASAEEDPFEDRPADATCASEEEGVTVEWISGEQAVEVFTGACAYATLQQPSMRAVYPGEQLKVRVAHYMLTTPIPGEAHLEVRLGDLTLLDEHIPIPAPAKLFPVRVTAEQPVPAGTPVYFHVHNHGDNTYAMVELSSGPAAEVQ